MAGGEEQVPRVEEREVRTFSNIESPGVVAVTSVATVLEQQPEYVPDGGMAAWTVVLGSTLAILASAGVVNTYGAFHDYYKSVFLPSSSSASISWVGSIQLFFLFAGGPFTGRIFDAYGTTILIPLGSALCVIGMMMLSLCEKDQAYQVFLSQGVLFGLGVALLFNPSTAVIGHWFRRRRATAIGVVFSGSAVGGTVFPIIFQRLVPRIGFPWAVRVIGFIIMACFIVACLTIKTRLPLSGHISWRSAVDLNGFKDPQYLFATISGFLLFYALYTPYFYIQMYASFRGVSSEVSGYLLAILNAMNVISRILPGILSDRINPLKCFVPAGAGCTILVLGLWMPSRDAASLIAFSALYGLFSGGFLSLLPTYIATITPRKIYGARLGSVYIFIAIAALIGAPTTGALLKAADGNSEEFEWLIIFTGALLAMGTVVLVGAAVVGNIGLREKLRLPTSSRMGSESSLQ